MYNEPLSPWELFGHSHAQYGSNIMFSCPGKSFTYNEVYAAVDELGSQLRSMQFRTGGIYLPNSPGLVTALLALNKAGKIAVPLSCRLKGESLYRKIQYADIQLLVTDSKGYAEILKTGREPGIKTLLVMTGIHSCQIYQNAKYNDTAIALAPDVFGICFTGGTTAQPKGVVLSNAAAVKNVRAINAVLTLTAEDCYLLSRPLAQAGPIICDLLVAISRGARLAFLTDIVHPGLFLAAVKEYKPTITYLVRTMLTQLLAYPRLDPLMLAGLRKLILGSMSTPHSLLCRTLEKLPGIALYNIYGLSEAGVRVTTLLPEEILLYPGSVGRPLPGCSITVYTESGKAARPLEQGEIYLKTPSAMEGYYKNPVLTAAALTPRGLKTGDCGYLDEHGNLYILGRMDDMIIQGGCNIYPAEIEEILLQHPAVAEAAVIGVEDATLGEKAVAIVRPEQNHTVTKGELLQWCRRNMEDSKMPKAIVLADSIPRNDMGKLNRQAMEALYADIMKKQTVVI